MDKTPPSHIKFTATYLNVPYNISSVIFNSKFDFIHGNYIKNSEVKIQREGKGNRVL